MQAHAFPECGAGWGAADKVEAAENAPRLNKAPGKQSPEGAGKDHWGGAAKAEGEQAAGAQGEPQSSGELLVPPAA